MRGRVFRGSLRETGTFVVPVSPPQGWEAIRKWKYEEPTLLHHANILCPVFE